MHQRRARVSRYLLFSVVLGVALFLLLFGLPPQVAFSDARLRDYKILVKASQFAGPHVGFAAVTPEAVAALRRLEASESGPTAFKYALLQGTTAAKLYALVGLKRTSPNTFAVFVQPFRIWPGYVPTMFGCVMSAERTNHIVAARTGTAVRLHSGETLHDWWLRTRPNGEVQVDIIGGGYSSTFFDLPKKRNAA